MSVWSHFSGQRLDAVPCGPEKCGLCDWETAKGHLRLHGLEMYRGKEAPAAVRGRKDCRDCVVMCRGLSVHVMKGEVRGPLSSKFPRTAIVHSPPDGAPYQR